MPVPRIASADDTGAICELLQSADLPTADLETAHVRFVVLKDGHGLLGVIGMEVRGDAGLVRSFTVRPSHRGRGLGTALLNSLEQDARDQSIGELYLLTQTAEMFFGAAGYALVERDSAPGSIRESAEFRSICPASAVCMHKSLPTPCVAA